MTEPNAQPVTPRLSATVMIIRDTPDGIEVFMVVRHHKIEFAAGAIVFPGGSLDQSDRDPRLREVCDGIGGLSDDVLATRVAAAREAFEECGVLFARAKGTESIIDGVRAKALGAQYRMPLESDEIGMADVAQKEELRLAIDQLTHFAHWITPAHMRKRFNTHFYLAPAPGDHALVHDGGEAVASQWVRPVDALTRAEAGELTMIFATRLNLERLAKSTTVAEAIEHAKTDKVVTVEPVMRWDDGNRILTIPIEAGYGGSEFIVKQTALADDKKV